MLKVKFKKRIVGYQKMEIYSDITRIGFYTVHPFPYTNSDEKPLFKYKIKNK